MEDTNKVRITCDPFQKIIEYAWYDSNMGEYTDIDEDSKLRNDKYVYTTIQNRTYEILEILNGDYNPGNTGLTIEFAGTADDYRDICEVIDKHCSDSNITCVRGAYYYNSASEVMPKIKEKFAEIKGTLDNYTEDDIVKLVDKYNDTIKPSISVCVMGLYSVGKSAFINSMVGEELLPSASDPTTAKVYKITHGKKYEITFSFDQARIVLEFDKEQYQPNSSYDKEIIAKLNVINDINGMHPEVWRMNKALEIINNYKSKEHKIGDLIEVQLPFYKTAFPVDDFDFVIFDTPGSNSATNTEHFEVLKRAMDEQTNALPVLVTRYDSMDAEDNIKILNQIEQTGTSLDTTNTIIIVNRSDEAALGELDRTKKNGQNMILAKWKSTRIFFLSAILGIASKKDNPEDKEQWLDKDMLEKYDEKKEKYISDKRKLYEYNIVDKSRTCKNNIQNKTMETDADHLYQNSGLAMIEQEIIEYARKYAFYNKCQQASEYLQKAIDLCVKNVQDSERELETILGRTERKFDAKRVELCKELENKKECIASYNAEYQKMMQEIYQNYTKSKRLDTTDVTKMAIYDDFNQTWQQIVKEAKKYNDPEEYKFKSIQNYVNDKLTSIFKGFATEVNDKTDQFWYEKVRQFKKECRAIIMGSAVLNEDQKKLLDSIILNLAEMNTYGVTFNLRSPRSGIENRRYFFGLIKSKKEKFVLKDCCKEFCSQYEKTTRNRIISVESGNTHNFTTWVDSLIRRLKMKLVEFNPELKEDSIKISNLKNDIEGRKQCEHELTVSKEYIDGLLGIQGGSNAD